MRYVSDTNCEAEGTSVSDRESLFPSRTLARLRNRGARHAARVAGTSDGPTRGRRAKPQPAEGTARPSMPETHDLGALVDRLTPDDLRLLAHFVVFLAERRPLEKIAAAGRTADAEVAASDEVLPREAVSIVLGPCDGPEHGDDLAQEIASAPGFEPLLRSFREGYHHITGRAEDPATLAAWIAQQESVADVELDLDTVRVLPRQDAP